jgi:hypothetical protein
MYDSMLRLMINLSIGRKYAVRANAYDINNKKIMISFHTSRSYIGKKNHGVRPGTPGHGKERGFALGKSADLEFSNCMRTLHLWLARI